MSLVGVQEAVTAAQNDRLRPQAQLEQQQEQQQQQQQEQQQQQAVYIAIYSHL